MEQEKRNPRKWFASLRMSAKIMMSVGILIFCSNLLIMSIICYTSSNTLKKKISDQIQNQLSLTTSTMTSIMTDIEELMITMAAANDIEDSLNIDEFTVAKRLDVMNSVNEELRLMRRMNNLIDYVALIRIDKKNPMYAGVEMKSLGVYDSLLESAEHANLFGKNGVSMNLMRDVYDHVEFNMFCPIYGKYSLHEKPKAYIVVGLNTKKIYDAVLSYEDQNIKILDMEGVVLVSGEQEEIGTTVSDFDPNIEARGQKIDHQLITAWQKSSNGVILVESSMSKYLLLADIYKSSLFLIIISMIFTFIALWLVKFFCQKFYEPMEEMLSVMSEVTAGNLDKTMKIYEGRDFKQISYSFNDMTNSLRHQMDMIRQKEQENTEIRLNALQSQIKPHFLYNTLECIHWQALLEGAKEASKMVMALSRYYRLSLSKGAEIIPLSQELEHTKSYIMIQNIRFDNILNVEYDIPEELERFEILKITLQPLIENAIYHGIKPLEGKKGHVRISGKLEDEWMILKVEDDGMGMSEEKIDFINKNINVLINDGSYGVKNVHTRLEIRYGQGSGLHYESNEMGGITVTVKLPAKRIF